MKSFKVVDLKIAQDNNFIILDVIDGIIINKETKEDPWLIEVQTSEDFISLLESQVGDEIKALVTITRPNNQPAQFIGKFLEINKLEDSISILFLGNLIVQDPNYAEDLLENLMKEGYTGGALLNEFKARMDAQEEIKTSE
ncbi:YwpF family protein [Corticicoccus populi]|uniref:YwpF family protein n=1 Tax=Corticicoccus populi TaxID=1812821 RepID=A0ABW5WV68_9STAP